MQLQNQFGIWLQFGSVRLGRQRLYDCFYCIVVNHELSKSAELIVKHAAGQWPDSHRTAAGQTLDGRHKPQSKEFLRRSLRDGALLMTY